MRVLFVMAAVVVMVTANVVDDAILNTWRDWKIKYGKSYASEAEEDARRAIWSRNLWEVAKHNVDPHATYTMEMNGFADKQELKIPQKKNAINKPSIHLDVNAPSSFDWRDKGVISAVKNQGMIGYPEAFVAAECVESFHAIHNHKLYNLSVDEVGECCSFHESKGGVHLPIVDDVFGCIHNIGGLCTTDTYQGKGGCGNKTCTAVAQVTGTKHVPKDQEAAMQPALMEVPLFVAVNAGRQSFQMYKSGIYNDPECTEMGLDHVLQLVGYGKDDKGNLYWICKNSWGETWGMNGYINIERGVNRCGIAAWVKYPY